MNTSLKQFTAPSHYALWWEMTKSCSGLDRDVSGVRFYSEPADKLQPADAATASVAGEWNASSNSITLTDGAVQSATVVRHEMLHALIVASGHPADKFSVDCGGYVNCEGVCAQSANRPTIDATAARLETTDVEVSQKIFPAVVDMSKDADGWFALIVEVKNTKSYPVQVKLSPFPGRSDIAATIGYSGDRTAHQEYVSGALLPMLPGETRRMVYDMRAKDFLAENGSMKIRGFFNNQQLPVIEVAVKN